jgi:CDGSH-type Zn-finger protein
MSDTKPKIQPAPNGPLIIEGLTNMRDMEGEVECQAKMALCRCGASGNKPFCDGTHAQTGFSSDKSTDRTEDRIDSFAGKQITIHDNRSICAHAGRCTEGLPDVWRMKQEPWIDPDAATPEEIIAVIRACPSGALSYTIQGSEIGGNDDRSAEPSAVFIAKGGPYAVSGDVQLDGDAFGMGADKGAFTLCRCGASKNKPFCDGTHWSVTFDE